MSPRITMELGVTLAVCVAEDAGFEPARGVAPTRFPSVRHRPLGESSAHEGTRPDFGLANRIQVPDCRGGKRQEREHQVFTQSSTRPLVIEYQRRFAGSVQ